MAVKKNVKKRAAPTKKATPEDLSGDSFDSKAKDTSPEASRAKILQEFLISSGRGEALKALEELSVKLGHHPSEEDIEARYEATKEMNVAAAVLPVDCLKMLFGERSIDSIVAQLPKPKKTSKAKAKSEEKDEGSNKCELVAGEEHSHNIVLKYCEIIDEFIHVKIFSDDQELQWKDSGSFTKEKYQKAVMQLCVKDLDAVLAAFRKVNRVYKLETLEQLCYQICVEVNPHLELHRVQIGTSTAIGADPNKITSQVTLESLQRLAEIYSSQMVGQPDPKAGLLRAFRKPLVGTRDPNKTRGVYLFLGPTGVGKTHLGRLTALGLYGSKDQVSILNCEQYKAQHAVENLKGSPVGYIGHGKGGHLGQLAEKGVILLDEIEKAHSNVHHFFLGVWDSGIFTSHDGGESAPVDLRDNLFILTSNVGNSVLNQYRNSITGDKLGFGQSPQECTWQDMQQSGDVSRILNRELEKVFPLEFINRLDGIFIFDELTPAQIHQVINLELNMVKERVEVNNPGVQLSFRNNPKNSVISHVFNLEPYDPKFGCRPMARRAENLVSDSLTAYLEVNKSTTGRLPAGEYELFVESKSKQLITKKQGTNAAKVNELVSHMLKNPMKSGFMDIEVSG